MVVWTLACERGVVVAGYAPISGTFRRPLPEACPGDLVHYHGTADAVVPMGGRAVGDSHQGRLADAFALMAEAGGLGPPEPRLAEALDCSRRTSEAGRVLELCLFDGGHLADAWDPGTRSAGKGRHRSADAQTMP